MTNSDMTDSDMTNLAVTLVLGGARSGKSAVGERLAAPHGAVTYLATGAADPDDAAWTARIAAHRARRPAGWHTVEIERAGDLGAALAGTEGAALVDSLGTWVAGHHDFVVDTDRLLAVLADRREPTILVSDEVGSGVHPATILGGAFRDSLGDVNRRVGEVAGCALLVVAGRTLALT